MPLAAAAGAAPVHAATDGGPPAGRLAWFEDLEAIRALNRAFAGCVNGNTPEAAAALFADPAAASACAHLRGIVPDGFGAEDVIEIAPDRETATGLLYCTVQIETVIGPTCPLVEMAREQGGGVVRRTEPGVLEQVYVRRDAVWTIQRATYRGGSRLT